jgi:hypothetical protein
MSADCFAFAADYLTATASRTRRHAVRVINGHQRSNGVAPGSTLNRYGATPRYIPGALEHPERQNVHRIRDARIAMSAHGPAL